MRGKVALVTGGGRGIGRAVAERFAREGVAVALVARTAGEVRRVADDLTAQGARALPLVADVSLPAAVEFAIAETLAAFGRLDILVNNAGIWVPADALASPFEDWNRVMEVDLYGAVHCARAAGRAMVAAGEGGAIVNVSSIHGTRAEPGGTSYAVAKGALDQLTRALAVELAPHRIRVNGIAPGFVETAMAITDGVSEHETEWFREIYVGRRKIPLARPAAPEEVAAAICFLASDDASYITGQILGVDGGLSVTF